jgi:hypothetical protein
MTLRLTRKSDLVARIGNRKINAAVRVSLLGGLHVEVSQRTLPRPALIQNPERVANDGVVLDVFAVCVTKYKGGRRERFGFGLLWCRLRLARNLIARSAFLAQSAHLVSKVLKLLIDASLFVSAVIACGIVGRRSGLRGVRIIRVIRIVRQVAVTAETTEAKWEAIDEMASKENAAPATWMTKGNAKPGIVAESHSSTDHDWRVPEGGYSTTKADRAGGTSKSSAGSESSSPHLGLGCRQGRKNQQDRRWNQTVHTKT